MNEGTKDYFQLLEMNIGNLPLRYREQIYQPCAVACVKDGVLLEQKQQFDACHGDMDLIYETYPKTDYYFRKIIERGHIYEMGYPRCLCHLVEEGFCQNPCHCECSRQSILYILKELMPEAKIQVKTLETVLGGATCCRFRITIN